MNIMPWFRGKYC